MHVVGQFRDLSGRKLVILCVDAFATNCIVRKKRRVAAVARGPLSQQGNSFLRAKPVASFGLSFFLVN
jgi:hypothetical protein